MPTVKFYSIWLSLICVIAFIFQSFISWFTDIFVLNNSHYLQIWRFITAIFLHGSLVHLMYNLFALILFGLILEKFIGSNKFLLVFFVSGILANIVSVNFYPVSLGASGAIMGVIGALAIVKPFMTVWAFGMIMPMSVAAVLWIVGDVVGVFVPDNVGHIAHLSGVAFGAFFGIIFRANHEVRRKRHMIEVPEHILRRWETLYMGGD